MNSAAPAREPSGELGVEIETLDRFDTQVATRGTLAQCYLQSLDLTGRTPTLAGVDVTRAVFLGCTFAAGVENDLEARGALVFPTLPQLPFNPYRAGLYHPDELYRGLDAGYRHTMDARIFRWWRYLGRRRPLAGELACALHDHAIGDALDEEWTRSAYPRVGVMGGHAALRGSGEYAAAARLGHRLAGQGYWVVTGGGPGAMEATNLGAGLSGDDLPAALDMLAGVPSATDIDAWAAAAFEVRRRWDVTGPSFGIPTWYYGHEPPNVFVRGIAKYFSNALREETLLDASTGGLVILPGAAGTVQEVMQSITTRYYATDDATIGPLILVGVDYWTLIRPVWPLLASLAAGRRMAGGLHLVDSVDEAAALLP